MDVTTFDTLIKRLATTRLTRWQALRGMAAGGVAALTGVSLLGEEGEAKKDKPKKKTICHRGSDVSILGTTKKVTKKGNQKHFRQHPADYKGKCTAARIVSPTPPTVPPVPPPPPPGPGCVSANCPKFETCVNNQCGPCTLASQCPAGEACLNGRCIGGSGRNAITCDAPPQCQAFSAHLSCEEVVGTSQFFCLAGTECAPAIQRPVVCPTAGETCVLGDCVVPCGAGDTCGMGFECRGGFCFD